MLDGLFQSFSGLLSNSRIPHSIGEIQYFRPPVTSSVRAEIVYPPQLDGRQQGITKASLYPFNI
jgi:hypothetical protein